MVDERENMRMEMGECDVGFAYFRLPWNNAQQMRRVDTIVLVRTYLGISSVYVRYKRKINIDIFVSIRVYS